MTQQRQQPPAKPMPHPENPALTKPFWEAARRHELVIQRCKTRGHMFFYPREVCPECLTQDLEWIKCTGRGWLYSWTTVFQSGHPAFAADAPYVYALIQLEEGPRIIGSLTGVNAQEFLAKDKVNTPVQAVFDDVSPEQTLIKWKPAS